MAPPGPPRESQSSIRTTQPTPTIEPKPNVKYSTAESRPGEMFRSGLHRGCRDTLVCNEEKSAGSGAFTQDAAVPGVRHPRNDEDRRRDRRGQPRAGTSGLLAAAG